jgi:hypothetical protein
MSRTTDYLGICRGYRCDLYIGPPCLFGSDQPGSVGARGSPASSTAVECAGSVAATARAIFSFEPSHFAARRARERLYKFVLGKCRRRYVVVLSYLASIYAPFINYYGSARSRARILQERDRISCPAGRSARRGHFLGQRTPVSLAMTSQQRKGNLADVAKISCLF